MRLRTQNLLLRLAKPLLRVHLELYRHELASAPFPTGEPELSIAGGTETDRLAFIGSIAVSGYGVLDHGMKTSTRTAARVSASRRRSVTWTESTTPTMTGASASRLDTIAPCGTDAVMILLGITDVLLGTSSCEWEQGLVTIVERVRSEVGAETTLVFAEIPPMAQFQELPPFAARLLTAQVASLNAVSRTVAERTDNAAYVPFPEWDVGTLFIQQALSWATMHNLWSKAIAPVVVDLLDSRALRLETARR